MFLQLPNIFYIFRIIRLSNSLYLVIIYACVKRVVRFDMMDNFHKSFKM